MSVKTLGCSAFHRGRGLRGWGEIWNELGTFWHHYPCCTLAFFDVICRWGDCTGRYVAGTWLFNHCSRCYFHSKTSHTPLSFSVSTGVCVAFHSSVSTATVKYEVVVWQGEGNVLWSQGRKEFWVEEYKGTTAKIVYSLSLSYTSVCVCVCLYFVKDCGIMGVVLFIPKRPPLSPVDRIPCEQLTFLQTTVIFKVGICTKVAYHVHISYLIANCGSLR